SGFPSATGPQASPRVMDKAMIETLEAGLGDTAVVRYDRGKVILVQGQVGAFMYVVLGGRVAITLRGARVERVGPGGVFGAVAVAVPLAATAQEGTLKKVKDSGSITIGHRDASIPFSYYDDKQQPVGYAVDLCLRIVDSVKNELKMPKLDVKYQLVTSANRIPLMANGTIDLELDST